MAEPTWWSLMIFLQVRVCVFTTFYLYAGGGRTPQASSAGTDDEDVWGNRADFWIAAHALVSPQALHVERRTNTRKHARTLAPGGARLHTPGSGRRAALRSYSYLSSVRARSRTPALRRSRSFHGSLCPVLGLGRGSGVQWPARGVAGPLPPPQLPLLIALSVPDQTEGYYTVGRQ